MRNPFQGRRGNVAARLPLLAVLLGGVILIIASLPTTEHPHADTRGGFREVVVLSGLDEPTNLEFAPDGRVVVAEKGGTVKVFDSLEDQTPATFADLSRQVHAYLDRGLLGLALPPGFPDRDPHVYVLYTHDAPIGGTAPVWEDTCPAPPGHNPGPSEESCVVSGRLSRLGPDGPDGDGLAEEEVLLEGWCQQYPSHSVGDLAFGPDGALYASAGDGASFNFVDYGQGGSPPNPCGDPPGGVMRPPGAEGGALRAQDVRTPGDPTGLDGAVLRLDPASGEALPDNPLAGSADPGARRVVAYGLRNPFRLAVRPGTGEVWVSDVGLGSWEEVNRVADPTAGPVNFGWPCYEGPREGELFAGAGLRLCERLYQDGGHTAPYYAYQHRAPAFPGDACRTTGGTAISGLAFYPAEGGAYPAQYRGALFLADYSRGCIWVMRQGADGLPDPDTLAVFTAGAASPVDLEVGPGGDLYYLDHLGGTVRRVRYFPANQPPVAVAAAEPATGPVPLAVRFSAAGSRDPDPGEVLSYAWDFTSDGTIDATGPAAAFTYTSPGRYTATLTVTDPQGMRHTATVVVTAGSTPPSVVIEKPAASLAWSVGEVVRFSGRAHDAEEGPLPASALSWSLVLHHCTAPEQCHAHPVRNWEGVASGSFTAPDHEYPSYLELTLTAKNAFGLSSRASVKLEPRTVAISFNSSPPGALLSVGSVTAKAPFTYRMIVGSRLTVTARSPQRAGATSYRFERWSDGGALTHDIVAGETDGSYTAFYVPCSPSCG